MYALAGSGGSVISAPAVSGAVSTGAVSTGAVKHYVTGGPVVGSDR